MEKRPRYRPHREYPDAQRIILDPDIAVCPFCGQKLKTLRNWHSRKTIQTLNGPLFVAGHTKVCPTPGCRATGQRFYAGKVWRYSLPRSSYGLDVLAYIGWEHDHGHRQLVEIQRDLNAQGVEINERNVGKLYRQFLALLSGTSADFKARLQATVQQYGGVIWAIDGLEPEGTSRILYVLYEVLSGQPFGALQGDNIGERELVSWLSAYQDREVPVLATLSDGQATLIAALKACWPHAPHQRCQVHFLNNLAEDVLDYDDELRKAMRQDLGGLPKIPTQKPGDPDSPPLDPMRMQLEIQLRAAIREAVNRGSRKPFLWGGLKGFEQLESIAQALADLPTPLLTNDQYLALLRSRIEQVLTKNRAAAADLMQAYQLLLAVARGLQYPPARSDRAADPKPNRQTVAAAITRLIQETQPTGQVRHAQLRLLGELKRRWELFGAELLYCYEIPGLPQDNLKLESLFGRLRRNQRRISGRSSTRELQAFGQAQVLFTASSFQALLDQIQQVPRERYAIQRQRLAEAEQPRQFFHRLHQAPSKALTAWIQAYAACCQQCNPLKETIPLTSQISHTE